MRRIWMLFAAKKDEERMGECLGFREDLGWSKMVLGKASSERKAKVRWLLPRAKGTKSDRVDFSVVGGRGLGSAVTGG